MRRRMEGYVNERERAGHPNFLGIELSCDPTLRDRAGKTGAKLQKARK